MKFLILFTFGALFGSACCESKCFNKKFATCAINNITDIKKVYSSCETLKQQARCFYSASLDCETAFIPEAYIHQESVTDICGKSDDYMERYRKCFARAVNGTNCLNKHTNIMKNLTTPQEILGGLRGICKEVDWFGSCLQGNTEDECGGIASDYFYESVLTYELRLQKLLCSEVIVPADEKIHDFVVLGLPRVIEFTIALLNVP